MTYNVHMVLLHIHSPPHIISACILTQKAFMFMCLFREFISFQFLFVSKLQMYRVQRVKISKSSCYKA